MEQTDIQDTLILFMLESIYVMFVIKVILTLSKALMLI